MTDNCKIKMMNIWQKEMENLTNKNVVMSAEIKIKIETEMFIRKIIMKWKLVGYEISNKRRNINEKSSQEIVRIC